MTVARTLVALLVTATMAWAQNEAPKGIPWKDNIDDAKSEAASKGFPILIFVPDETDATKRMHKSFEDASVIKMLKHFARVCFVRSNVNKFQAAYVPWICDDASKQYQSPLLVFGDPKGNVKPNFRSEGKNFSVSELLEHLQKVLHALAPAEEYKIKLETLDAATLPELFKMLSTAFDKIELNLAEDKEKLIAYREEVQWADAICKYAEAKAKDVKDKKEKEGTLLALKNMKKNLADLDKFKGKAKEIDGQKATLDKARETLKPFLKE